MKKRYTAARAALALTLALALLGGCSGGNSDDPGDYDDYDDYGNSSNSGADDTVPHGSDEAGPQEEQGSVTLDTNNGDLIVSSIAEKPATFPDDIPLPGNAVIVAAMEQVELGATTVAFDAHEPYETVVQLYRDYVANSGYTEVMPITDEPESYWFAGSRGEEQLVVIISKDLERDGISSGMLTYKKHS